MLPRQAPQERWLSTLKILLGGHFLLTLSFSGLLDSFDLFDWSVILSGYLKLALVLWSSGGTVSLPHKCRSQWRSLSLANKIVTRDKGSASRYCPQLKTLDKQRLTEGLMGYRVHCQIYFQNNWQTTKEPSPTQPGNCIFCSWFMLRLMQFTSKRKMFKSVKIYWDCSLCWKELD